MLVLTFPCVNAATCGSRGLYSTAGSLCFRCRNPMSHDEREAFVARGVNAGSRPSREEIFEAERQRPKRRKRY